MIRSSRSIASSKFKGFNGALSSQQMGCVSGSESLSLLTKYSTGTTFKTETRQDHDYYRSQRYFVPHALVVLFGTVGWAYAQSAHIQENQDNNKGQSVAKPHEPGFQFLDLKQRQRMYFYYEKRMRDHSQGRKVFNYFASVNKCNEKFMTPDDLLRSLVSVYPPNGATWERGGCLDGERPPQILSNTGYKSDNFYRFFDVDGDGLLSYDEWVLVKLLMSICDKDISVIFSIIDNDQTGQLSKEEFLAVLHDLETSPIPSNNAFNVGASERLNATSLDTQCGLLSKFFGKDGKKTMEYAQFKKFLRDLHEQLVKLEFYHYDWHGDNVVTGVDFARSLVSSLHLRKAEKYMNKATTLPPRLMSADIQMEDFMAWANIRRKWHTVSVGLKFVQHTQGYADQESFKRIFKTATGVEAKDDQVQILYHMFGVESVTGQGVDLDLAAMSDAFKLREAATSGLRREARGGSGSYEAEGSGLFGLMNCCKMCMLGAEE